MKMKQEHFDYLKAAIQPLDTEDQRKIYASLTDQRYRWDLLWKAGVSRWIIDNLYKYLHDGHIDTALRKIVPPLKKEN